jgi:hypothetical protein
MPKEASDGMESIQQAPASHRSLADPRGAFINSFGRTKLVGIHRFLAVLSWLSPKN